MPRGKGGARQGTPGKGYANRTDLMMQRAPQTGMHTAATAGMEQRLTVRQPESTASSPAPAQPPAPTLTPDMTPMPFDPTAYPNEPLTTPPLGIGPQNQPDEATMLIRSLMALSPNPDLRRLLARMENR